MAKLRRNNIVRLRILVDERGQVADTQALDKVELLTDASMKAVRRWHYRAATKVGVPVRVWIDVRIVFELPGS
jgi:TonB family protein